MQDVMRCVLLCLTEVLDVSEVMHCVPLCLLDVVEAAEVMRRWLLCMVEAVDGELCLLESWRRCLATTILNRR